MEEVVAEIESRMNSKQGRSAGALTSPLASTSRKMKRLDVRASPKGLDFSTDHVASIAKVQSKTVSPTSSTSTDDEPASMAI